MFRTGTLEDGIAAHIELAIVAGRFKQGAHLRQDELARELRVSHIPVREALRRLESRGFVELLPRRGARVARITARDIEQHLEARIVVEGALLVAAIPRLTADDIASAAAVLDAPYTNKDWPERNWQFHRCLYAAAENRVLFEIAEQLHQTARARILHRLVTRDHKSSLAEHRRLLDLTRKGKTVEAISLLRRHIGISSESLKTLLRKLPQS